MLHTANVGEDVSSSRIRGVKTHGINDWTVLIMILNGPFEDLSKRERVIASTILQHPLCSGEELARFLGRSASGVHAIIRDLRKNGLINSVRLGCLRPQTERLFFSDGGLRRSGPVSSSWHQPAYRVELLARLPSLEHLSLVAAGVADLGTLCEWQWMSAVGFDAAARYEDGWAVFFWVGPLRQESRLVEIFEELGEDLEASAVGVARPRPSLLCCVAYDRFQAEMVTGVARRLGMANWVRVWCIADETWHGADGHLNGRGWIRQPAYRRNVGNGAWEKHVNTSLWAWEANVDIGSNLAWVSPSIMAAPKSAAIAGPLGSAIKAFRAARKEEQAAKEASGVAQRTTAVGAQAGYAAERAAEATERAAKARDRAADSLDRFQKLATQWADLNCECVEAEDGERTATCDYHEAVAIVGRVVAHTNDPTSTQDLARTLYAVAEWPAATVALVRALLGEKSHGRRAQRALMRLNDLELLVRWKTGKVFRYRITKTGMKILVGFDRADLEVLWKGIQMKRWDDMGNFTTHEYGVVDLMTQFAASGCPVANGPRDSDDMAEYGGIVPDAMVYLHTSPFGPGWHYVEYERSKRTPSGIAKKLKGFDSPRRKNDWPVLMVCASDIAESHVQQWAMDNDVRIATTTIARLKQHGAVGETGCWSYLGQPAWLG